MPRRPLLHTLIAILLVLCFDAGPAALVVFAQQDKPLGATAQQAPDFLKHAGISQNLDQQLPLDAQFRDETAPRSRLANTSANARWFLPWSISAAA